MQVVNLQNINPYIDNLENYGYFQGGKCPSVKIPDIMIILDKKSHNFLPL
jgi:hypothetical protein